MNLVILDMQKIKRKYIIDKNKKRIAVQLDLKTYEKIEKVLEDYAFGKILDENDPVDTLDLNEAKTYYLKLVR